VGRASSQTGKQAFGINVLGAIMEYLTAFAGAYDKWVTEEPMEAKVCTILKQTLVCLCPCSSSTPHMHRFADNNSDSDEHHG
jgi:hypothetical protein